MERPIEVLPTPGGPTRQRILPCQGGAGISVASVLCSAQLGGRDWCKLAMSGCAAWPLPNGKLHAVATALHSNGTAAAARVVRQPACLSCASQLAHGNELQDTVLHIFQPIVVLVQDLWGGNGGILWAADARFMMHRQQATHAFEDQEVERQGRSSCSVK